MPQMPQTRLGATKIAAQEKIFTSSFWAQIGGAAGEPQRPRHGEPVRVPVGVVGLIFASTLAAGSDLQPITMGIYRCIGNNNQEWNSIMATAVVASVPAAVLLVLAQRYVAAGVTAGAVKD